MRVFVAGDEVLIPIRYLQNGATIRQIAVAEVTYYHVELETHDLLLAGGLAGRELSRHQQRHPLLLPMRLLRRRQSPPEASRPWIVSQRSQ